MRKIFFFKFLGFQGVLSSFNIIYSLFIIPDFLVQFYTEYFGDLYEIACIFILYST